ncbi:MAG: hypothetical protein II133_06245, partial [Lachnospiraceae bacterium]|nr:hypothetical protein [Lachnospiraceae bacterium]
MTDQKVRRKRTKKRITPAKAVAAFLCAALAVTFFYSRGTEAEQVTVPTAQTTSSGWGDASSQTNATESTAEVKLPQKTLTLDSCKKMAYATSDKLDELNDKLAQKEAAYEDKVKAAAVKIEYVKHFHWKFLLSFDFPRDLTFEELRQVAYEPKEALQEVKQVKEDMTALQMDLDQSVTDLYISIYKGRQSISIDEERLELANDKVATVTAMVATGEKNDEDLKEAQQKVKNLESRIVATTSANDASAKKLGKLLGLIDEYGNLSDPTLAGYRLEVPYSTDVIGKVERKDLGWLQRYTLEHDSTIF